MLFFLLRFFSKKNEGPAGRRHKEILRVVLEVEKIISDFFSKVFIAF
jgi:hypothetical protein